MCPTCQSEHLVRDNSGQTVQARDWPREGLTLEHINVEGEGPITFKHKADLSRYCNKHGLSSGALL